MNAVIMAKEYSYCAFDLRELMILEFGRVRIYEIDMHLRKLMSLLLNMIRMTSI